MTNDGDQVGSVLAGPSESSDPTGPSGTEGEVLAAEFVDREPALQNGSGSSRAGDNGIGSGRAGDNGAGSSKAGDNGDWTSNGSGGSGVVYDVQGHGKVGDNVGIVAELSGQEWAGARNGAGQAMPYGGISNNNGSGTGSGTGSGPNERVRNGAEPAGAAVSGSAEGNGSGGSNYSGQNGARPGRAGNNAGRVAWVAAPAGLPPKLVSRGPGGVRPHELLSALEEAVSGSPSPNRSPRNRGAGDPATAASGGAVSPSATSAGASRAVSPAGTSGPAQAAPLASSVPVQATRGGARQGVTSPNEATQGGARQGVASPKKATGSEDRRRDTGGAALGDVRGEAKGSAAQSGGISDGGKKATTGGSEWPEGSRVENEDGLTVIYPKGYQSPTQGSAGEPSREEVYRRMTKSGVSAVGCHAAGLQRV